jgi:drug/metabolite transporter (DMT)-like permease
MLTQILIASAASAATFVLAKEYARTGKMIYLGLAINSQIILVTMYVRLLQVTRDNQSNIFSIIKIVAVLFMFGYGIMSEPVTWRKVLGICFAVAALYLL